MPRLLSSPAAVVESAFAVVIDRREKQPYTFSTIRADADQGNCPLRIPTRVVHLRTGDYSIAGHEGSVAVERKSLTDLYGTLSRGRKRFAKEIGRLNNLDFAAVVVEADWTAVLDLWPRELVDLPQLLASLRADLRPDDCRTGMLTAAEHALAKMIQRPPERSRLVPKTIHRTVLAWQQRMPRVHWWLCPNRAFAEVTTYRILERWWKEHAATRRP